MSKLKLKLHSILISSTLGLLSVFSLSFALYNYFISVEVTKINGEVGISEYFDRYSYLKAAAANKVAGLSEAYPLYITKPMHFYNLSRLQELGAFSGSVYYFEIGKQKSTIDSTSTDEAYYTYTSNDADESSLTGLTSHYVYMDSYKYSASNTKNYFKPIGNHGTPFMSHIIGHNNIIENLTVNGCSDDVGVFGYCDSNADIKQIYFENLVINDETPTTNALQEIFYNTDSSLFLDDITYNTKLISTATDNKISDTLTDYTVDGTLFSNLEVTLPTKDLSDENGSVVYKAVSSNGLLVDEGTTSGVTSFSFAHRVIDTNGENGFLYQSGNKISAQIYILAQREINLITYSHVVNSYTISLENKIQDASTYTFYLDINKDLESEVEFELSPTHKENVGLICGHLDGNLTNCIVNIGTINTNNNDTTYTTLSTLEESDIGMVGQMGRHVQNYEMNAAVLNQNDTGYLFQDEIHDICVRTTGTTGGENFNLNLSGSNDWKNYFYYPTSTFAKHWYDEESPYYSIYQGVLKYKIHKANASGTSGSDYVVYGASNESGNNVIFKRNQFIKGGDNSPLGIFNWVTTASTIHTKADDITSITSGNNTGGNPYPGTGLGLYNGNLSYNAASSASSVFYIADEFRNNTTNPEYLYIDYNNSSSTEKVRRSYGSSDDAVTTLTTAELNTINAKSSAYFPQLIHYYQMSLDSTTNTYFNNTSYSYLKSILENTLVDYNGNKMTSGRYGFGVSLRKVDNATNTVKNITLFNYQNKITGMNSTNSTTGLAYDSTSTYNDKEYFTGKLSFSLKRTSNVTVAFAYKESEVYGNESASANNIYPYLTICKNIKESGSTNEEYANKPVAAVPYPNKYERKNISYFPSGGDDTSSLSTYSTNQNPQPIFVHTFKLKSGDYFLSTNNPNQYANGSLPMAICLLYIGVQGQDNGDYTTIGSYYLNNYKDVCFLLKEAFDPTSLLYTDQVKCVYDFLIKFGKEADGSIKFNGDSYNTTLFLLSVNMSGGIKEVKSTNTQYLENKYYLELKYDNTVVSEASTSFNLTYQAS